MTKRNGLDPSRITPVGYGRPPKETRFQPGKSGNPTGRRKGSRSVGAILNDVFRQKIEVTENGKTRRVTALEVMARRLRNDALRGDAKAIKLSIELMRRHSETEGDHGSIRRAAGPGSGDSGAISSRSRDRQEGRRR